MPDGATTKENANLRDDLDALRKDVAKLSEDVRSIAGDRIGAARDRARDTANWARERGEAAANEVGHRIEERPLTSVAVAFGVGMVIGRLLDRR